MNISELTFILTDDCNFHCKYCYKIKSKNFLDYSTAVDALNFFWPFLNDNVFISFYGGEPLLSFSLIKKIVHSVGNKNKESNKNINFSVSTNGSLINDHVISFFNDHKFKVGLSFDGIPQDKQRKKESFRKLIPVIRKLSENPKIELLINSVFTPTTIQYLSKSIELLLNLKVPRIRCSLSFLKPWDENSISRYKDELIKTRELLLPIYRKTGTIPIINFSQKPQISCCPAGSDRLSISTNGEIWGCPLFSDYFERKGESAEKQKYCFGKLEEFSKDYERKYSRILQNYSQLRMDHYSTPEMDCFLCPEIEYCSVCPISSSLSGYSLKKIPGYVCEIQKIKINEILRFFKEL